MPTTADHLLSSAATTTSSSSHFDQAAADSLLQLRQQLEHLKQQEQFERARAEEQTLMAEIATRKANIQRLGVVSKLIRLSKTIWNEKIRLLFSISIFGTNINFKIICWERILVQFRTNLRRIQNEFGTNLYKLEQI